MALAVGERLEQMSFPVIFTRTADVYQSPIDKARIANESGGDYFVSIHRNSATTPNLYNGVQTLVYNDVGVPAEMARNINKQMEQVGFRNLGVEERKNLAVLRRTSMPAVLVEAGFINSEGDNQIFDQNFDALADAIAKGIENTVGETTANVSSSRAVTDSAVENRKNQNRTTVSTRQFGVQIGLFRRFENAQYLLEEVIEQGYYAQILEWNGYYTVVVGREESLTDARELERDLNRKGYESLIVNLP